MASTMCRRRSPAGSTISSISWCPSCSGADCSAPNTKAPRFAKISVCQSRSADTQSGFWKQPFRNLGERMRRTIKVLALLLALTSPSLAQDKYPSRNIRLLVSFPPGGGIDAVARLFADKLTAILGQTVVVENRGGAAGLIAGRAVAAAEPDGYTVLIASNSMIIAQLMNATPGLSIERELRAVASVAPQANIVAAAPDLPVSTLKEAMELANTRPLTYSSPGTGSVPQLLLAYLITTLPNAKITHVPFPGAAQALTSTMSSQTELTVG